MEEASSLETTPTFEKRLKPIVYCLHNSRTGEVITLCDYDDALEILEYGNIEEFNDFV